MKRSTTSPLIIISSFFVLLIIVILSLIITDNTKLSEITAIGVFLWMLLVLFELYVEKKLDKEDDEDDTLSMT